jgi:PP-loop superfamily ATP-utilizing enzyme
MREWEHAYNCHSLVIVPKLLVLQVLWQKEGYKVCLQGFNTRGLKELSPNVEEAKKRGLILVEKVLSELQITVKEFKQ